MSKQKEINSKKKFFTFLILLFIGLTIIIFYPRRKLISTQTYEILNISEDNDPFPFNYHHIAFSYVDENDKIVKESIHRSDANKIIYQCEDIQKVTIEYWGTNKKIKSKTTTALYLTEETYKELFYD